MMHWDRLVWNPRRMTRILRELRHNNPLNPLWRELLSLLQDQFGWPISVLINWKRDISSVLITQNDMKLSCITGLRGWADTLQIGSGVWFNSDSVHVWLWRTHCCIPAAWLCWSRQRIQTPWSRSPCRTALRKHRKDASMVTSVHAIHSESVLLYYHYYSFNEFYYRWCGFYFPILLFYLAFSSFNNFVAVL